MTRRPLRDDELVGDPRETPRLAEVAARISAVLDVEGLRPSAGFSDRVMDAIALEPPPARGSFLGPLGRRGIAGVAESVRLAWLTLTGASRPMGVRGAALAYVLVFAIGATSLTGLVGFGLIGALNIAGPGPAGSANPTLVVPTPPPGETPARAQSPAPSVAPTESPDESSEPSAEPSESDDHRDGSSDSSGSSDSGASSGSDGEHGTTYGGDDHHDETPAPQPSRTPETEH